MSRQVANQKLVQLLQELVQQNPDQRFHQILRNYGFISEKSTSGEPEWINEFYSEPEAVLQRVEAAIKKMS